MKNISEIKMNFNQDKQSDNLEQKREKALRTVNELFKQLKSIRPAASKQLQDEATTKQQWVITFIENNINSEMLNAGMRVARRLATPYFPAVGEFLEWCEDGLAEQHGLIKAEELVKLFDSYCAHRLDDDFYKFEFGSDANYWLLIDLYRIAHDESLNKSQLLERAKILISSLSKKIAKGYVVPKPSILLPEAIKPVNLNHEQSLLKITEIKKKFGFNFKKINGD